MPREVTGPPSAFFMQLPYTAQPGDAFVVAQSSLAAALTAIVCWRPLRPLAASASLIVGIWLAALVPVELDLMRGFGHPPTPDTWRHILVYAAVFMAVGMLPARPRWIPPFGIAGWLVIHWLTHHLTESNDELAAAQLVWFGFLFGLYLRFLDDAPTLTTAPATLSRRWARDDALLFVAGVTLAALVSTFVLQRTCDSADEWAYTFQAAVLSHGHAYQDMPRCPHALEAHWVVYSMGRAFSQYTPGWPFFMAPFWRVGAVWLASPFAFGLLLVAVARIARRVAASAAGATSGDIRVAGLLAAATLALGACTLFNAGSRYSHVFVAMTFAWMVEALCSLVETERTKEVWFWGLALGSAGALCLAARPPDGAVLGFGVFLSFVHALIRGRLDRRGLAATLLGFSTWGVLTLIVLRLQLGQWFKTGYSVAEQTYPWAHVTFLVPTPDEWKYGLPLATGAYSFWPCAPALGILGLASARRAPKGLLVMLGSGTALLCAFYVALAFGRHTDFGYGPRFILPALVTMAVGTGAILARLLHRAHATYSAGGALAAAAPATIAILALVVGVVRLIPIMYPFAHDILWKRSALFRAIRQADLHHVVVTVAKGQVYSGPLLDTQNDPNEPDADVIIVGDRGPADIDCTRHRYPDRKFYRAEGQDEVSLTRY